MRVIDVFGTETEAFCGVGRVTVLGGPVLEVREFWRTHMCLPERRHGERRVTWERRKLEMRGRRHRNAPRRRVDALTPTEREALARGIEHVEIITVPEIA
jgi:hypothetical protein